MAINSTAPKRVLHVVSAMNRGGTETLIMNVYRNIDRSRVQFDFVSHQNKTCDYDQEIQTLGGKVYRIKSLGQSGPIPYIRELRTVLKADTYSAVHSHTDYQSGFPAFAAKLSGVGVRICHAHSNHWSNNKDMKSALTFNAMQSFIRLSATDYCACSTDAACFLFGKKNVSKGKVKILNNAIPIHEFLNHDAIENTTLRKKLGITEKQIVIGHVGNFSKVKNQSFILKILKALHEQGVNCIVVFAGDGPLIEAVKKEANSLNIHPFIRFLGVRQDIPELMKMFDVFVFPSEYEGFGMAAIEAQCAGTPCVVSEGVPDSTDMGLNLIIYERLNEPVSKWVDHIKNAIIQKRPAPEMIEAHFLKKGFAIQENIANWLALYDLN